MILNKIVQVKQQEVAAQKLQTSQSELRQLIKSKDFDARRFGTALARGQSVNLIAEVKKASPSKGVIRPDFDPVYLAQAYAAAGAAAISVLTDGEFFQGSLTFLNLIRENVGLPLLRKDFIIDQYQIYQSKTAGADAILLIARILESPSLKEFIEIAEELGMDALVEIHDHADLEKALTAGAKIIGINNRDLATFSTDLNTSLALAPLIPKDRLIVSESGVNKHEDLIKLAAVSVKAVLVGEALVREQDVFSATRRLLGKAGTSAIASYPSKPCK